MRVLIGILATLFIAWQGAVAASTKEFTASQRRWWAFQKVVRPTPPQVKDKAWVRNPVDAFILSKLEEKGIQPNPPADKVTLLRRATLDLTGLPPTLEETQQFLADDSPAAFDKVVDRLLASPHYGERWGRHWLDLARYADSEGFKSDETRPHVWRYRDYVINSFNQDKPYDRFVKEQIAGDELYPGDLDARVAVGFNRNFPDESNAAHIAQRRQELLNDVTDTVAVTFMGLTVGCARCHDHKFDPILHKDYYRLQAFFANFRITDDVPMLSPAEHKNWLARREVWESQTKEIRAEMKSLVEAPLKAMYDDRMSRFPEEIQDAIRTAAEKRTPFQWHMFLKAKAQVEFTDDEASRKLKGVESQRYAALTSELAKFNNIKPEPLPVAQTMGDLDGAAPKTYVLRGGAFDAPLEEVQPGFLSILDPSDVPYAKRRSALANWLASPENPLTARVMVNRIWHHHFGTGIAASPSDFGLMGDRPTNRELLDYLASELVARNWSLKQIHRLMVLSNTYQQSSGHQEAAAAIDPGNKLLWRYNRRRLEGEALRDSMLAVSGSLNTRMGGPGVFPPLPEGLTTRGGWKKNEDASEASRRSVYIFVRRNTRYPMMESFDMPDTHESCSRRATTISPAQSLELLNNDVVLGWSKSFASRVANDGGLDATAHVDRAFRLAFLRQPTADERRIALDFLGRQTALAGGADEALADLCHMLLNTNEFVYIN
ncbi:MAG: DUF1549 and DUF1553 domain-containing protein [Bryobacteraceae bacterium]